MNGRNVIGGLFAARGSARVSKKGASGGNAGSLGLALRSFARLRRWRYYDLAA
jgi:hypothetical protein